MYEQELMNIRDSLEKAEEDTKPIAAVVDDEVVVQGDPNNTKVEPKNYTVHFLFPSQEAKGMNVIKEEGGLSLVAVTYENVFPDTRDSIKYINAVADVLPFMMKIDELGGIERLSEREFRDVIPQLKPYVVDAIYTLVSSVLHIDDSLVGKLTMGQSLVVGAQILNDFPFIANQADLFFE